MGAGSSAVTLTGEASHGGSASFTKSSSQKAARTCGQTRKRTSASSAKRAAA
jgi:hypothetical protein